MKLKQQQLNQKKIMKDNLKNYTKENQQKMVEAAKQFLAIADELAEKVSAYFDGSEKLSDYEAYLTVRKYADKFTDLYNLYFDEKVSYGLNYGHAESVIDD